MDIDFCFNYNFPKDTHKTYNFANTEELSGFYIYNFDKAFINVGSTEFNKNMSEPLVLIKVTYISVHETLHKVIYDITKTDANATEEKFVDMMAKW